MQSRISVFSDENLAFGGFATADIRGKRAPISVLSEVGANQINSCVALQHQNIPGFYDRKPLYARGPLKPLNAQSENEEIIAKFEPALDYLQCGARAVTRPTCSVLEQPRANASLIESPMAVSPLTDETSKLHTPTREDQNKLLDDRYFTQLYGDTHYSHLRLLEVRLRPRPNYMMRQRDISSDMRAVLVDWLVEVNEEYQQSDETLFLTIALIDRFLSLMSVVRAKLQLVGTAAILVAAKVEEIYPPRLDDLVYITDESFTASQIIRMEALLLKNLDFFIGNAHPLTFIQNFGIMTQIKKQVALMAQYICELSLLTVDSLAYLPSELAAAGILLGLHHIEGNIDRWTQDVHNFSGIDSVQLQAAVDFLQARLLEAGCSPHKAIRNKYAHRKYSSVSLLPVRPTGPHVRWL